MYGPLVRRGPAGPGPAPQRTRSPASGDGRQEIDVPFDDEARFPGLEEDLRGHVELAPRRGSDLETGPAVRARPVRVSERRVEMVGDLLDLIEHRALVGVKGDS